MPCTLNNLRWVLVLVCLQGQVPVLDLPLPELDAEHVIVQCDDEVCHANAASRAQPEDVWRPLEGALLSGEVSR